MSSADDPYKYFRLEARELLEGLSAGLLALERGDGDKDLVARLFRFAHSLKGAARVVRLPEVARLAHELEDGLAVLRDAPSAEAGRVSALLPLVDVIAREVAAMTDPHPPPASPAAAPREPEPPLDAVRVNVDEMDALLDGLAEAGVQAHALRGAVDALEHAQQMLSDLHEQMASLVAAGGGAATARARAATDELRVVIDGARRRLGRGVDQVARELDDARDTANRLRLTPASSLFVALERVARDAAQLAGKRVELRATGGAVRLDGHVLAALRDALAHAVRNAVAHGIEAPRERAALGKPEVGAVTIDVVRDGQLVVFQCRDDGRGIDVEALRRAAAAGGVLSPEKAAAATVAELLALLLRGGVSTAGAVTQLSGRGVGLDVVRDRAERLGGEVFVRTEPRRGTTVEIRVPVSLSSIPAVLVEAGGAACAIPLDAVRGTVRIASADVARGPDADTILAGERVVPFVPLARAIERAAPALRARERWSAVLVESGDELAALGVDRLLGAATVVVKRLSAHAMTTAVVLGASLDAEGNPQIVLDPRALVAAARAKRVARKESERPPTPPILVVDDSLTTRMLEKSIFESAGFEVDLATSAEEALEMAARRRYGLFVVDVEMPGMDGFSFVAQTRAHPTLRETPAILVTSRDSPEDRRRGAESGARGYVVKGEFDQNRLLAMVRELTEGV